MIAGSTLAAGIIGGALLGMRFMGGVLAGGVITYANLRWVSAIVRRLIEGGSSPRGFAARMAAKEILLFAAVGALVGLKLVDAIGLLVGLSSLVLGVCMAALLWQRRAGRAASTEDGYNNPGE